MALVLGPGLTVLGYLLGSVCFGLVLAARRGVDLRAEGSGNIGATNVKRVLGARAGRAVMALDALKGFAPSLAASLTLGPDDPWTAATGVAATVGHVLPLWHGFKGGKGAATAGGVLLAVVPAAGALALVTFGVLKKLTRRASVGSLSGSLAGLGLTLALYRMGWPTAMACALLVIVIVRHRGNIRRLVRGEEPPS